MRKAQATLTIKSVAGLWRLVRFATITFSLQTLSGIRDYTTLFMQYPEIWEIPDSFFASYSVSFGGSYADTIREVLSEIAVAIGSILGLSIRLSDFFYMQ